MDFPKTHNTGVRVGLTAVQPDNRAILAMYGQGLLGADKYAQVNSATDPIDRVPDEAVALASALENGSPELCLRRQLPAGAARAMSRSLNEFGQELRASITLFPGSDGVDQHRLRDLACTSARRRFAMRGPGRHPQRRARARERLRHPVGNVLRPTHIVAGATQPCAAPACTPIHTSSSRIDRDRRDPAINQDQVTSGSGVLRASVLRPSFARWRTSCRTDGQGREGAGFARWPARPVPTQSVRWFNGCTPQMAASVDYYRATAPSR